MTELEAAYLAGFMDGEGTLTIIRTARKDRRGAMQYQTDCSVANTNLVLLQSIHGFSGDYARVTLTTRRNKPDQKPGYRLQWSPSGIREVLPRLVPYLRAKQEQAGLLLAYLAHVKKTDGRAKSQSYWDIIENFRVAIANLNVRGLRPVMQKAVPVVMPVSRQGSNQYVTRPVYRPCVPRAAEVGTQPCARTF